MENSKTFQIPITIRFKDCDNAGIVFYPRYFEMVVVLMEHWFEESIGLSFQDMHQKAKIGVPTITLKCDFKKPGLLGEKILCRLKVLKIGNTSADLDIQFVNAIDESLKLEIFKTIVCIDLNTKRPIPWSDELREAMSKHLI